MGQSIQTADTMSQKQTDISERGPSSYSADSLANAPINESGHKQELDRNFGLWNICGLALTSGNTWVALGGSIVSSEKPDLRGLILISHLDRGHL